MLKRYLTRRGGNLIINRATVTAEAKLDGKFLLSCTDDNVPAADAARLFKGLLDVERGFRDLKQVLEVRPVYHRKQQRTATTPEQADILTALDIPQPPVILHLEPAKPRRRKASTPA